MTAQGTGSTGGKLDNLTYDLITVIQEKSKGLEAYDKYLQDAASNQQCSSLLQRVRQQDEQAVQELTQALKQVLSGS